jgi:hypothetical protein
VLRTCGRYGKSIAAIVSVEDLDFLQALEDRIDVAAARKALKQRGRVAWDVETIAA